MRTSGDTHESRADPALARERPRPSKWRRTSGVSRSFEPRYRVRARADGGLEEERGQRVLPRSRRRAAIVASSAAARCIATEELVPRLSGIEAWRRAAKIVGERAIEDAWRRDGGAERAHRGVRRTPLGERPRSRSVGAPRADRRRRPTGDGVEGDRGPRRARARRSRPASWRGVGAERDRRRRARRRGHRRSRNGGKPRLGPAARSVHGRASGRLPPACCAPPRQAPCCRAGTDAPRPPRSPLRPAARGSRRGADSPGDLAAR